MPSICSFGNIVHAHFDAAGRRINLQTSGHQEWSGVNLRCGEHQAKLALLTGVYPKVNGPGAGCARTEGASSQSKHSKATFAPTILEFWARQTMNSNEICDHWKFSQVTNRQGPILLAVP